MATQEQRVAMANYEMPEVKHGMAVSWYPTGLISSQPQVAFVIRVSSRNIHLHTAMSGFKEAVRHIDDPKLQLNADQREMGAWGYTDDWKALHSEMRDLNVRVRKLESIIDRLVSGARKPNVKGSPGLDDYRKLKKDASDAGVKFTGNPKREWLNQQIASKADSSERLKPDVLQEAT